MLSQVLTSLQEFSLLFLAFMGKEILYSSILFAIVFALSLLLRRQSIYLQYGLWAFVFLRLVLPPDISFNLSARSVVGNLNLVETTPSEAVLARAPAVQAGLPPGVTTPQSNSSASHMPGVVPVFESPYPGLTWQVALFLFWAIGVPIFAMIFLRRYTYYLGIVRRSAVVHDRSVMAIVETWCQRFEIRRKVTLVASSTCLSPFTIGIFRPTIYLPSVFLEKSSNTTIESVIAHELAHIKNYDDLWIKLQNFIQIVYFFHPVVWLANSQINQTRERICDELVLANGSIARKTYGSSMLAVLKMNLMGAEGVEMLSSFGNHKKRLSVRIQDIAKIKIKKANLVLVSGMLLVFGLFFLPMAGRSVSMSGDSSGSYLVKLRRTFNQSGEPEFQTAGAASKFLKISDMSHNDNLCTAGLDSRLTDIQYAAIGIFDLEHRKVWVLKGENANGEIEFYVDTDGDCSFDDEDPVKTIKKTSKYIYEGSSEWVWNKYVKAQAFVKYRTTIGGTQQWQEMAVHLVYHPQANLLEFYNNEFWIGEVDLGGKKLSVALYGGVMDTWYLRSSFDSQPDAGSRNEIRLDLNDNGSFERVTVFDPANGRVLKERHYLYEAFWINDIEYTVEYLKRKKDQITIKIVPKVEKPVVSS